MQEPKPVSLSAYRIIAVALLLVCAGFIAYTIMTNTGLYPLVAGWFGVMEAKWKLVLSVAITILIPFAVWVVIMMFFRQVSDIPKTTLPKSFAQAVEEFNKTGASPTRTPEQQAVFQNRILGVVGIVLGLAVGLGCWVGWYLMQKLIWEIALFGVVAVIVGLIMLITGKRIGRKHKK